jgi:hypothetical protein
MTPNDDPVRPSSLAAFLEAVNGKRGDLDAWLEVNDEAEVRAHILAALSTRPQAAAAVPLTYQFEVWQDDMCVASGEGTELASIKAEAAHYAANYAQDGPVKVEFYGRFGITPPEGASE